MKRFKCFISQLLFIYLKNLVLFLFLETGSYVALAASAS